MFVSAKYIDCEWNLGPSRQNIVEISNNVWDKQTQVPQFWKQMLSLFQRN